MTKQSAVGNHAISHSQNMIFRSLYV